MNYDTYRDLIFLIIPNVGVIEEATGWAIQGDTGAPKFPNHSERVPFYYDYELDGVYAVFKALEELSAESRELKLAECLERKKTNPAIHSGYIPLEISPIDYKFWARKSIWAPNEAALLSLGFIPTDSVIDILKNLDDRGFSACLFLKEYSERIDLIVAANRSGQLDADGNPIDLIKWFTRLEYDLPKGLAEAVSRIHSPDLIEQPPVVLEKKVWNREKESLLKLVAAMAIRGYSFSPEISKNSATKDIQDDLDHLGIGLDQKTILKWLREATGILPIHKQD